MLYLGTGDGGGKRRPSAKRTESRLAARQDSEARRAHAAVPYSVGQSVRRTARPRPEIWAYGVRNPWRFSFDPSTQSLYIADVGQNNHEEVNVVAANAAGLNYGWNIWEGTMCYPSGNACSPAGITMPVLDYDHGNGAQSPAATSIGGATLPEVAGRYFYSDFCNGWLRSFLVVNGVATERLDWHVTPDREHPVVRCRLEQRALCAHLRRRRLQAGPGIGPPTQESAFRSPSRCDSHRRQQELTPSAPTRAATSMGESAHERSSSVAVARGQRPDTDSKRSSSPSGMKRLRDA